MDYCCSDENEFIEQFVGKNIQKDTDIYTEIANMLLLTEVRHPFNCDKKRYYLEHSILPNNDIVNIITSYKNKCTDTFSDESKKKTKEYIVEKMISFILKNDTITSIDYTDWKR
jgi:hypothetical protein